MKKTGLGRFFYVPAFAAGRRRQKRRRKKTGRGRFFFSN
jgi:hypothetical protein